MNTLVPSFKRSSNLTKFKKKTTKEKAGIIASRILCYTFLILLALIVIVPLFYIVTMSFDKLGDANRDTFFPTIWSLDGFVKLFTKFDYLLWYGNTIIVGIMNMVIVTVVVTPTAYAFSRIRFKGRKNLLLLFMVIQMFPGMMAMLAYYVLLTLVGLHDTHIGLALIYGCTAVPASTFLLKGFLDTMSRSLEEAARLDGANRMQLIVRIILPLALPMIGLVAIFGFAAPFGDYILSKVLLRDPNSYTLALGLQTFVAEDFEKDYSVFGAGAILASVPMTVLYIFLQKFIFRGLGASMTGSKS